MNSFTRYLREHRNKIFAVSFSALAVILYAAAFLVGELTTNFSFFRSSSDNAGLLAMNVISALYCFVVYMIVFICNVRNDSTAYVGILLFVFYTAFSALMDFLEVSLMANPLLLTVFSLSAVEAGVGIALYVFVNRYRAGYAVNWKLIRGFAVAYAGILLLIAAMETWVYASAASALSYGMFLSWSEAALGGAIVFTLERLRRF